MRLLVCAGCGAELDHGERCACGARLKKYVSAGRGARTLRRMSPAEMKSLYIARRTEALGLSKTSAPSI